MLNGLLQYLIFFLVLLICIKPLGYYIAKVFTANFQIRWLNRCENLYAKIIGQNIYQEMYWQEYLGAVLIFNALGFLLLFFILSIQNISFSLAFNIAASFVTNTDWQSYGNQSMSYLTKLIGFTTQNFLSSASGFCVLIVFVRSLIRKEKVGIGNFWLDLYRGIFYILLPLSILFAFLLMSQGVIQNFKHAQVIEPLQKQLPTIQKVPMGPVASEEAIKLLGSNGGGFFNTNSAHPFANPTPFTNFIAMIALLLIPGALYHAFGFWVKDKREGNVLLVSVFIVLVAFSLVILFTEFASTNFEGKEIRFGIPNSSLFATLTTATSNGATNAMHASFAPLSLTFLMILMQTGEVIFGGVGSGLYSLLLIILLSVFVAALMVGRTPEYLGKKIEPFETGMVALGLLIMPVTVLIAGAVAVLSQSLHVVSHASYHFTEILYAITSMGNNNGSAMGGLNVNTTFYNILGGILMLVNRYALFILIFAIAGRLVKKNITPTSAGTLCTHSPLFGLLLIIMIFTISALCFFPALSLGPLVDHFLLWSKSHG